MNVGDKFKDTHTGREFTVSHNINGLVFFEGDPQEAIDSEDESVGMSEEALVDPNTGWVRVTPRHSGDFPPMNPDVAGLKGGKTKGRFEVMQLVENGPWYVVELGPSNQMKPWYGPFSTEEEADIQLEHGMTAGFKAADDEEPGEGISWSVNAEDEDDGRGDISQVAHVVFQRESDPENAEGDEDLPEGLVARLKKALIGKTVPTVVEGYPDFDIEEGDFGPFSIKVYNGFDYKRSEQTEAEAGFEMAVEEAVYDLLVKEFGADAVDYGTLTIKEA